MKEKKVSVYALGVGSDVEVSELIDMGTSPDYVYSATDFDELSVKVAEITQSQCKGKYSLCKGRNRGR